MPLVATVSVGSGLGIAIHADLEGEDCWVEFPQELWTTQGVDQVEEVLRSRGLLLIPADEDLPSFTSEGHIRWYCKYGPLLEALHEA